MTAYQYLALDQQGHKKKGIEEGDNPRQIRQQIRERGWIPLEVDEAVRKEKTKRRSWIINRGIRVGDLALLTRQMATLMRAALPIEECLYTVANQSERERIKKIMMAIRSQVIEGQTLAQALSGFPKIFKQDYVATVRAGEQSGKVTCLPEYHFMTSEA